MFIFFRRSIKASMILSLLVITACAPYAYEDEKLPPPQIATPASNESLVYFFRPKLDHIRKSDSPSLIIDNKPVAELPYATYTVVSLPGGQHNLQLSANSDASTAWNTQQTFNCEAGKTYFVALWNTDQPTAADTKMLPIPINQYGALMFIPIMIGGSSGGGPGVRLESVDRETALYGLAGLQLINPQSFFVIHNP